MRTIFPFAFLVSGGCDADRDGLSDRSERAAGLDPKSDDSDGDGLLDADELAVGADALNPDTDADRLPDGDEADHGADPLNPDTDGDGYLDGDEVAEGSDPGLKRSKIYKGGWPYYYAKDELPRAPGLMAVGEPFLRFALGDQFGDEVDLYDFYNQDHPVVVVIGTAWDSRTFSLGDYIRGGDDPLDYGRLWEAGPAVVARGDVRWIDVLAEDINGSPAYADAAETYADAQPDGVVLPVLADGSYALSGYTSLGSFPTVIVLDPQLRVIETDADHSAQGALRWLAEAYPE